MRRPIEKQRFEFLLLINGNIICQRYFDIRNYNEDSIHSMEMKELIDNIAGTNNSGLGLMGMIPKFLQGKSREYLWGYYRPHTPQRPDDISRRDIYDKIDNFGFQIRIDGKVVGETQFSGNVFPPKVRYQVNIKDIIPDIISEIRQSLSKRSYTDTYGGISLKYDVAPHEFEV
jgi:hypothetical protein